MSRLHFVLNIDDDFRMSGRRVPTTIYSSRCRQRSTSNPYPRPAPSSSPIKQLDNQDEELSVEEMSRRMTKRSRNNAKRYLLDSTPMRSASLGASPLDCIDDEAPPFKKKRITSREPLATIKAPCSNIQRTLTDNEETVDMDITSVVKDIQVRTPAPREIDLGPEKPDTVASEEVDSLSPLPTLLKAKRVIAHRSNSNLRENATRKANQKNKKTLAHTLLDDLDSPFHSRPGSPNATGYSHDKSRNKILNRTRSVGTDLRRRATLRSHSRAVSPASNTSSPATRRHPSQPTSRMNLRQENKEWLVPAQFKPGLVQKTPRRPSDAGIPFLRESSFFESVPDACSTPVRHFATTLPDCSVDIDATPRLPHTLRPTTPVNQQDTSILDDPTPRASIFNNPLLPIKDSLFPPASAAYSSKDVHHYSTKATPGRMRRRITAHYSQDSIFSSALDFSMTASGSLLSGALPPCTVEDVHPTSMILAPPSSPIPVKKNGSSESSGDELRDMFSTLGLDGMVQSLER